VITAAQAAQADGFIRKLSLGYDTVVGEQGLTLSDGQRQRVALARAVVALARAELVDPDILLLDEATAVLDLATEAAINRTADRLTTKRDGRRRTVLIIAHRLTTAARADRVVVLDHGRVVEDGPHKELLAKTGHTPDCGAPSPATQRASAKRSSAETAYTPASHPRRVMPAVHRMRLAIMWTLAGGRACPDRIVSLCIR
jgi:ABC-type bacteriocin/lantibiotic exporter with double-glycine peptidase domain